MLRYIKVRILKISGSIVDCIHKYPYVFTVLLKKAFEILYILYKLYKESNDLCAFSREACWEQVTVPIGVARCLFSCTLAGMYSGYKEVIVSTSES